MRLFVFLLVASLALAGCKKPDPAPADASLLSEVKTRLTERDKKLASYRFKTTVTEGANEARFEFSFRSPNKMKGVISHPTELTYAFDGSELQQLTLQNKKLVVKTMEGGNEQTALMLNRTFAPFAPEGFRAPLLVRTGVSAKKVAHPKAREAVEVVQEAKDDSGTARVSYVFRWPQMDFLGKTSEIAGQKSEVRVDEEHCDEKLQLCVPMKLSQLSFPKGGAGQLVGTSVISEIELSAVLPNDAFTLATPDGFERVAAPAQ